MYVEDRDMWSGAGMSASFLIKLAQSNAVLASNPKTKKKCKCSCHLIGRLAKICHFVAKPIVFFRILGIVSALPKWSKCSYFLGLQNGWTFIFEADGHIC